MSHIGTFIGYVGEFFDLLHKGETFGINDLYSFNYIGREKHIKIKIHKNDISNEEYAQIFENIKFFVSNIGYRCRACELIIDSDNNNIASKLKNELKEAMNHKKLFAPSERYPSDSDSEGADTDDEWLNTDFSSHNNSDVINSITYC
jgi:hypothetical protein